MPRPPDEPDPAVADTASSGPGAAAVDSGSGRGKGPRQVRAGDTLGRYEIGDELGEGGMATVFRARDRELRRDVAVKVLFPHLARRAEVVRRFHREARAAAGLEHPNILRIYDVGGAEGDDPPYIVMELIRGRTLLQEIEQRGAMLAEIAACIGALLADALAAAHAAGVVHRDVKPANVLIAPGGRLLLADFGVARLETEDSLVTRTGALLGTPAYMSPEQASGDVATARSDLYSLGATLYQLATGVLPFSGSPAKVMSLIASGGPVPPVRRRAACGPEVSRLIERLMAADPEARPAPATAVADELRGLAATGGFGDATEELAAYFADPEGFLRARTPVVVTALITAATAAIAGGRLPRAMALADRASAIAPEDPAVAALVHRVTAGGHASRRRRVAALGGLVVALAGGATALAWQVARSHTAAVPAPGVAQVADAQPAEALVAERLSPPGDARAAPSAAEPADPVRPGPAPDAVAAPAAPARDAGPAPDARAGRGSGIAVERPQRPRDVVAAPDARARGPAAQPDAVAPRDASTRIEAAPEPSEAGAPRPTPPEAAPVPELGHVIVRNDVWCNISIDRVERGNHRNEPLEVAAGHHVVRCVNPAGEWTQEVDVAPGATRTLIGSLLRELEVTLGVDATIDGTRYARGAVVKLKPGNVEVIAGGKRQFLTFRVSCTLRDAPELGCYL